MDARDKEASLLARCVAVARQTSHTALDQREANVFRLAGMVLHSKFPSESRCLVHASETYFEARPTEKLPGAEVIKRNWILDLPRLRDMLNRLLEKP